MNISASLTFTQAKCLQTGKDHPIAFIRTTTHKLISFIDNPRKHFKELLLRNKSFRQTREEGRVSIAVYLTAFIIHTDLATGICGWPTGRGGIMPYSIEYLAKYAGIEVDIAKKWHSALSKCGYISNNKQASLDKRKGIWSSLPSIKKLSQGLFASLGIAKKLYDATLAYFKKKAIEASIFIKSNYDAGLTIATHLRNKFIKPELRQDTEHIPPEILKEFIPKILKK